MRRANLVSFFFLSFLFFFKFFKSSNVPLKNGSHELVVLTSQKARDKFLREALGAETSFTAFNINNHF